MGFQISLLMLRHFLAESLLFRRSLGQSNQQSSKNKYPYSLRKIAQNMYGLFNSWPFGQVRLIQCTIGKIHSFLKGYIFEIGGELECQN